MHVVAGMPVAGVVVWGSGGREQAGGHGKVAVKQAANRLFPRLHYLLLVHGPRSSLLITCSLIAMSLYCHFKFPGFTNCSRILAEAAMTNVYYMSTPLFGS